MADESTPDGNAQRPYSPDDRLMLFAANAPGVLPDDPDQRDYVWVDRPDLILPLNGIDHSHLLFQLDDQFTTGSCVAQALTNALGAIKAAVHAQPVASAQPLMSGDLPSDLDHIGEREPFARLPLYRHAADLSPVTAGKDAGTTARNALKVALRIGVAPERLYPFNPSKVLDPIPPEIDAASADNRVTMYQRAKDYGPLEDGEKFALIRRLKEMLATGHTPIVGMALATEFFYLGKTAPHNYLGMMRYGAQLAGYHEMCIVGWISVGVSDYFILANSWTADWGAACGPWPGGFGYIPALTLATDAMDIWAVTDFDEINVERSFAARQRIAQLYVALFGRAPNLEGMRFWTDKLMAGGDRPDILSRQIADDMFATDPARSYYPAFLTNPEIVAAFYQNVLGRPADPGGLAFWSSHLNRNSPGWTICDMIDATAQYRGVDKDGLASAAYFNGRARKAQVWAESGGGISGSDAALS